MQIPDREFKRLPIHLQALFVKVQKHDEVEAAFAAFGESKSAPFKRSGVRSLREAAIYNQGNTTRNAPDTYGDTGTASRFFYSAKATAADRAGSKHPTVKPQALMRWLLTLIVPPGGRVLDPFAGSGSTLQAAAELGFDATGCEIEAEYLADIARRLMVA